MGRKSRSPNYPRLGLAEAIEQVNKVYKKERTHKTSREAVAEALGYTSLNGASMGKIGTLRQYGLLEEDDDGLRVSQDAVALVMLPEGDPERVTALRKAAFAPRLFSELRSEYGETLPSDVSLRYALIKKGFTEKAANDAIRAYRDTLEFVSEEAAEYTDAGDEDQQEVEPPMTQHTSGRGFPNVPPDDPFATFNTPAPTLRQPESVPDTVLQFQISKTTKARIELTGDVTQEAIERLALILDAQKMVFPEEDELKQAAVEPVERPAIELPAPE